MKRLKGTPYLLLNDFGEIVTFEIFFKEFPNSSLRVVFPQLPVMAMIIVSIFFLKIFEILDKKLNELFTNICF